MSNKSILIGVVFCLVSVLAWGGMFPIMTSALAHMDAFYFTGIRYVVAGLILIALLLLIEGRSLFRMEGRGLSLWLFGSCGFSGFGFLVFLGQKLSGPSGDIIASVMMALMPVMSIFINWGFKRVRPKGFAFVAVVIALFGTLLVISNGNFANLYSAGSHVFADVLILLGALCWVIYTFGGSQYPGWSPLRYTTLTTCLGSLTNIVIIAVATAVGWLHFPTVNTIVTVEPELWYMILVAGVLAVFTWNSGNKTLKPVNGSLFMNIVPITTTVIATIMGHGIGSVQMLGILIVVAGLLLNNVLQRRATVRVASMVPVTQQVKQ